VQWELIDAEKGSNEKNNKKEKKKMMMMMKTRNLIPSFMVAQLWREILL
jgi:hypothetical protein